MCVCVSTTYGSISIHIRTYFRDFGLTRIALLGRAAKGADVRSDSGASLGGPTVGPNRLWRSVYGPYAPFSLQWCIRVGVSRCGPAAVAGRGCLVICRGKLIIIKEVHPSARTCSRFGLTRDTGRGIPEGRGAEIPVDVPAADTPEG